MYTLNKTGLKVLAFLAISIPVAASAQSHDVIYGQPTGNPPVHYVPNTAPQQFQYQPQASPQVQNQVPPSPQYQPQTHPQYADPGHDPDQVAWWYRGGYWRGGYYWHPGPYYHPYWRPY